MPKLFGIAIVWFSLHSTAMAQTAIDPSKGLEKSIRTNPVDSSSESKKDSRKKTQCNKRFK